MARTPDNKIELKKASRPARYILKDIDPHEFSLVPIGENGKRFFLLKSHNEEVDAMKVQEIVKNVLDGDLTDESKLDEIMKTASLADDSQQAIKAALRLLSATEVPTDVRKSLLETSGILTAPEATEVVEKAVEEEDVSVNDNKPGGEEMEVLKGLSLSAEVQEKLEAIIKERDEAALEKIEKMQNELQAERDVRMTKEYIAKACEFSNLDVKPEEFGPVLKELSERYPEGYEKIAHVLKTADVQIGESKLFDEVGTSTGNDLGSDPYAKLEKMADELVIKSDGEVSKADAMNSVLQMPEGKKLYAEYENQRASGRA